MGRGAKAGRTRREALRSVAGAAALIGCGTASHAAWAEAAMAAAIALTGGRRPETSDRIRLTLPRAFERGDAVPLMVEVKTAMTDADYVKRLHLLAEANPLPEIASFHFTPRSGRGRVVTRIRLAKTQNVMAVAEMGDGAVLMAQAPVEVETGGCK